MANKNSKMFTLKWIQIKMQYHFSLSAMFKNSMFVEGDASGIFTHVDDLKTDPKPFVKYFIS